MATVEIAEKWLDAGGVRTRFLEAGAGEPVVFIHGGHAGDTALAESADFALYDPLPYQVGSVLLYTGSAADAVGPVQAGRIAETGETAPVPLSRGSRTDRARGTRDYPKVRLGDLPWRPLRSAHQRAAPYPWPPQGCGVVAKLSKRGKHQMGSMAVNELGPMLTATEVAEMLHLHVNTVKRLGDRGELPFYRVCKRGDRRFRLDDVMKFLTQNR